MLQISDREWKAFFICDICEIESGRDIYDAERVEGDIPYITSTASNNGIKYYVSNTNETLEENAISVNRNGSVGYSFYHKYKALYSNDCRKLKLKRHSNEFVALFITNQITQQKDKYNYDYKMGTGRLKRQRIMLPIDNDGQPDYDFMENFIKEREEIKRKEYLEYVNRKILENRRGTTLTDLKSVTWREFFVKDIFPQVQRGKRLIRENQTDGGTPYVSSSALNNGVDNFIGNTDGVRKFNNCLSLANSGSVGSCFYEPFEFVASDHVTHLKNDKLSAYQYLFVAAMLNRLSEKYNFNREINDNRISREKIFLPVDESGNPCWLLIENYMRNAVLRKYQEYVSFNNQA